MSHKPPVSPVYRHADALLVPLVAGFGLALAAGLWGRGEAGLPLAPWVFGAWVAGALLPRLHPHPYRVVGLAPFGAALALAGALLTLVDLASAWTLTPLCFGLGLGAGAVLRFRDRHRHKFVRFNLAAALGCGLGVLATLSFSFAGATEAARETCQVVLIATIAFAAIYAWLTLARPAVEVVVEIPSRLMYDASAAGPGLGKVPQTGACLVVANHAAWFDPLFVAEVVPRATTPMMTASFYDLPVMRTLMRRVFGVIRVPEQARRRSAPEIEEAIKALDRGECVVIFPEGYLRRAEEPVMRRFGQGVWQILKARPDTPVVPCWVEGSWGSYFSHHNGPPTKNKKRDLRRPIRVGLAEPLRVGAETLADHLTTRVFLMNQVLAARAFLGLPAVPAVELPPRGEEPGDPGGEAVGGEGGPENSPPVAQPG